MCLHRYVKGSLVGKFSIGVVLGLLLFVATFVVNVPGASAYARITCSRSDYSYRVVRGDTLSGIGYRFGTRWSGHASYNHIANPNLIYVGQTICIPARGAFSNAPVRVQIKQKSGTAYVALRPVSAGNSSVASMINQVFGPYGPAAINVARCESGLNPSAHGPSGAAGIFQIMPGTWAGTSKAGQSPYHAYANIVAAHQIFVRDGYSWTEWTCKP
jgi:LysM repeat protein